MGQALSEKVMRILLATFKVQGNCFLLEHSREQPAEALRPRGQSCCFKDREAENVAVLPGEFDDSGWSASALESWLNRKSFLPGHSVTVSLNH